jgi:uncharacterized membrane protein
MAQHALRRMTVAVACCASLAGATLTASVSAAATDRPAILELPLAPGAVGGGVFGGRTGNLYLGQDEFPDGSIRPVVWMRTAYRSFRPIRLYMPPGMKYGFARSANSRGDILVNYQNASGSRSGGYVLSHGRRRVLYDLTGSRWHLDVSAIGEDGTAYGDAFNAAGREYPVEWPPSRRRPARLPLVGRARQGLVRGVNREGLKSGALFTARGAHLHAATWSRSGRLHELPLLGTGRDTYAYNSSRAGTVAGWATPTPHGPQHAAVWPDQGTPVDLGVLPGDYGSRFFGISEDDVAVGNSYNAAGTSFRAIYWAGQGPLETLPTYGAPTNSAIALYATPDDEVLGWITDRSGHDHPVIWEHASRLAHVPSAAPAAHLAGPGRHSHLQRGKNLPLPRDIAGTADWPGSHIEGPLGSHPLR